MESYLGDFADGALITFANSMKVFTVIGTIDGRIMGAWYEAEKRCNKGTAGIFIDVCNGVCKCGGAYSCAEAGNRASETDGKSGNDGVGDSETD